MTNSRFTLGEGSLLNFSKSFVKYLLALVLVTSALVTQVFGTITVSSTPPANNDFCGTGFPTLTLPIVATSGCGAGTITYEWYVDSVVASTKIVAAGSPNYSGWTTSTLLVSDAENLNTSTSFYAILKESSGACSDIDTVGPFSYTKVSSLPGLSFTGSPLDVCQNETATYTVNITTPVPTGTVSYLWYNAPDGGAFGLVQTTSNVTDTFDSYTYTAVATDDQDRVYVSASNACGSTNSDTTTLDVNPKPIVTIPVSMSTITACEGDGFNINYSIDTASYQNRVGDVDWTISWTGDAALIALLHTTGTGDSSVSITGTGGALLPGVYEATATLITNNTETCSRSISTNSINVTVYPKPIVTFLSTPVDYCRETGSTTFQIAVTNASYNNGSGDVNIGWSVGITEVSANVAGSCVSGSAGLLGATLTGTGNDTILYTPSSSLSPGTYTYEIDTITNTTNTCGGFVVGTDSIGWSVRPRPSVTVSPTSKPLCEGDSTTFNINITNAEFCTGATVDSADWSLTFVDSTYSTIGSSPLVGTGNGPQGPFTTSPSLDEGTYVFDPGTITNTEAGHGACARVISGNTFTLTINPEPSVTFSIDTIRQCQGTSGTTFDYVVSNAVLNSIGQNWSITYSDEGSRATSVTPCTSGASAGIITGGQTGNGDTTKTFTIPSNLAPGFYRYVLTNITNTSAGCTGTPSVGLYDTLIIIIDPTPIITMNPDIKTVCEDLPESFNLQVTNTKGCSEIGAGNVYNADWTLTGITDNVDSDLSSQAWFPDSSGNATIVVNVNISPSLTPDDHSLISSVYNSTTGTSCAISNVTTDTFILSVDPRPEVKINSGTQATDTIDVCEGTASSFSFVVTNAEQNSVGVDWDISYTESSGNVSTSCANISGANRNLVGGTAGVYSGTGNDSVVFVIPDTLSPGRYTYTITNIVNTDGPCTGTVNGVQLGSQTIVIQVFPRPTLTITPADSFVCENSALTDAFSINVTNAEYCPSANTVSNVAYDIYYTTDDVVSNVGGSPYSSSGNGSSTFNANVGATLGAGSYLFITDSIVTTNLTTNCSGVQIDSFELIVNPEPDATFIADTIHLCQGATDSVRIGVTNAMLNGSGVNWRVLVSESSGTVLGTSCVAGALANIVDDTITGNGNDTVAFFVPGTAPVGLYTYTITEVQNMDASCVGAVTPSATVYVYVYPEPTFTVTDTAEVCEDDVATSALDITVANAEYCSSLGTLDDVDYSIYYSTDAVNSTVGGSPYTSGSGNNTYTFNANSPATLTQGYYLFITDSIVTTGLPVNCPNPNIDTFVLQVNPMVSAAFSAASVDVCEGDTTGIYIAVTNADLATTPVNWEITVVESSANVPNLCINGAASASGVIGGTLTGSGNKTGGSMLHFNVPNTLDPGRYVYIITATQNTDGSCNDTLVPDTLVLNVYPRPLVSLNPTDSFTCETSILTNAFNITVTNAEYCPAANTLDSVNYDITLTDAVASNVGGSPYSNLGNGVFTFNANTAASLTAGTYNFTIGNVATTGLSTNCSHLQPDTFTLTVNPEPVATFTASTVTICEGNSDSIGITVSNALLSGSPVNWQMLVSETSGNIPSSCNVSAAANADVVPDTITSSGNSTTYYTIPNTLDPGIYLYVITGINNTDANCTGTVTPVDSVFVYVYPKISAIVSPDSGAVCEGDQTTFNIDVTNARYCSALNTASLQVAWTMVYTDATGSDIFPDPLTGSGNSYFTFNANFADLAPGYYTFSADTMKFTTPSACDIVLSDSNTFVLTVNPEPEATFSANTLTLCEGSTGSFDIEVTNATLGSSGVAWSIAIAGDSTDVDNSCATGGSGAGILPVGGSVTGTGNDTTTYNVPATLKPGVYTYTLSSISNTGPPCTGVIGTNPTITIVVHPQPDVDVSTDSLTVCENTTATVDITVTNAQYCASIGGSLINVGWEITHTDATNSTIPASIWVGTGNMSATTYTINNTLALTAPGPYKFDIAQIENTTHGCVNTDSFSGNELIVMVDDLPVLTILSVTSDTCLNEPSRIDYAVTDVGATHGWSFIITSNGNLDTLTGIGPDTAVFYTAPYTTSGIKGITYSAITNTTTGCVGNTPGASSTNILALPDVTGFSHTANNWVCSGLTNDYSFTVINSLGKGWQITYNVDGGPDSTWTGTGNGSFTRAIGAQYYQDSTGTYDTRPIRITNIIWTSGTPICENNTVTDSVADVVVRPRPYVSLNAPERVCVNYTADVDYNVNGVDGGQGWSFDWYTTGPTDGPNNETGTGGGVFTYTTDPLTPVGTSTVYVLSITNTTSTCDSSNSGWIDSMIVDPPTVPGTLSPSYTICDGDVGPFTFNLTGYTGTVQHWDSSENLSYLWFDIGNAGIDSHTVVSPHLTTNYQVVVKSGACPADTSNDVILFVHPQPQATMVSATDSICTGSNIDVVFDVSGVPNTHTWTVDYTVQIGAGSPTASTWTGTGSSATNSRTLTNGGSGFTSGPVVITIVGATNNSTGCDTTISSSKTTVVKSNPVASTASSNDTLCQNSNGFVKWDGTSSDGYVVGWQKKLVSASTWSNITGSAGDTLEFVSLTASTMYRAVIENAPCTGQAFSAAAIITVVATNPTSEFINLPSTNKHCASPTSTTSLSYNVLGTNGNSWSLTILEGDSLHTVTGTGDDTLTFTSTPGMMEETFVITLVKLQITSGSTICTKNLDNAGTATVTIIEMPTVTLNSVTTPVCDADTVTMSITVGNITTAQNWSLAYTINSVSKTETGQGPGTFNVKIPYAVSGGNATQSVVLTSITNTSVTATGGGTCTNTLTGQSLNYVVRGATSPGTIGSSASVCKGASGFVTQTVTSSNGSTLTDWLSSTWNGATWTSWTSLGNTSTSQAYVGIQNTTRYRAVYTNSPCDSASSNVVMITVLELPTGTLSLTSGNDTICEGGTSTVTLTVANISSGQGFTINYVEGSTSKTKSFTHTGSTTYTFTTGTITSTTDITLTSIATTSGVTCSNTSLSSTVTVTVQENPTGTIATYDSPLCHGETVDYTLTIGNVGSTDSWTAALTLDGSAETATGTGVGTFAFTTTNTVTSTSDVLLLVSVTNNSTQDVCATTINQSKTITVAAPTVAGTIGTSDTVCRGASGTVSQSTSGTGSITDWLSSTWNGSSWTTWASTGNSNTSQGYTNLQNTTRFRTIYTNSPCDTAGSNTVTIAVKELPVGTLSLTTGNDTICEGTTSTVTLTVSNINNGQSFTINYVEGSTSKTKTFTNNASNTHTFTTGTITSTTDITLTSIATTSGVTCSNTSLSSTVTVTVQENPTGTIATYDSPLCHGETVDYTLTIGNVGSTDSWTAALTLDGSAETATGTGVGTFAFTTTNTVTSTSDVLLLVSVTNNSTQDVCATTINQSKTITVAAPTVAGTIGTSDTVCRGASGTVSQSTSGTGSITDWLSSTWNGSTWTAWASTGNSNTSQGYTNLQNTIRYRAIYTNSPCDTAGSNTITIAVKELPVGTLSLTTGNDTICEGTTSTVTLTVSNINNGQSFTINYVEGSTSKTKTFTNNASNTHTFTTGTINSTTDITLTYIATTSDVICSNSNLNTTVTVTVQENPTGTIATYDSPLCHGETVDYTLTIGNVGSTDSWTAALTLDGSAETATGTGVGTFAFTTTNTVTSTSDVLLLVSVTNNSTQDVCATTINQSKTITVAAPTVAGTIGTSDTVCRGASGTVSQITSGTGSITDWLSSTWNGSTWTAWASTGNSNTSQGYTNLQNTIRYRAIYTNSPCDTAGSNTITIAVKELPVGTLSLTTGNDTICEGTTSTVTLTVSNINNGQSFTINYVEGSTSKTKTFTNNASNTHTFTTGTINSTTDITLTYIATTSGVICSNSNLNTTVTVTVQENPTGTIASYNSLLCHGETVDYSLTIGNVGSTDSWTAALTLDGNTETATGTGVGTFAFTTTNTVTSTSDVLILVSVTNNSTQDVCATTINQSKSITVSATTVAGTIGASDSVCKGSSGTIVQTASGVGSIDYWLTRSHNGSSWGTWSSIGNTSTTQTYTNLQNTAQYKAVYINYPCDTASSNTITITVLELPTATLSLTTGNDTICEGTTSTVTVTVANIETGQTFRIDFTEGSTTRAKTYTHTGSSTYTFTTNVLTSTTVISLDEIQTTSRVTCNNTNLNSSVTVTVNENPTATIASADKELCHGETVDYTVTVGSVGSTDLWELDLNLDGTSETVYGTGTGTFSFTTSTTVTSTSDILTLDLITNLSTQDFCYTALSDAVTIDVDTTTVPGVVGTTAATLDTTICVGGSASISEYVSGVGNIVKWQSRVSTSSTWVDIAATSTTINVFNVNDTTEYRAVYQNGVCLTAMSNSVFVNPKALPLAVISTIVDDSICAGTTGDFEVTVTNVSSGQDFTLSYSEGSINKTANLTQNASGVHTLTSGTLTKSTLIQLTSIVVTSGHPQCSDTLNSNGTITVLDLPYATITSGPDTLCQLDKIVFTVNVSNVISTDNWELIYELESDLDTIYGTGPGSFTQIDTDTNTAESAKIQLVEIRNLSNLGVCKSVNTDDWDIYIFKPTEPGTIGTSDTICKGGSTTISEIVGTPKQGVTVSWEYMPASASNWTALANSNTTLNVINLQETTSYRAIYKSGVCDTAHSNIVTIDVRELPLATIAGSTTICAGDSTDLTVTVTNVGSTQDWKIDYLSGTKTGVMTGTGGGTHTLRVGNFITDSDVTLLEIATTSGIPQCLNDKLTNNAKATVDVNPRPFASLSTTNSPVCQGSASTFTVTVSNVRSGDAWTLTYDVDDAVFAATATGTGPGSVTIATPTLADAKTYTVELISIVNNTTSCDSNLSSTMSIVVDATTQAGSVASDTTVCYGAHVGTVTHTGGNGSIVRWEVSTDAGTSWATITSTASTYTYNNLTQTSLFRVVKRNGIICAEAATAPITVTVNSLPVASISGSDTICAGTAGSLTVTASNTQGEDWSVSYLIGTRLDTISVSGPLTTATINTGTLSTTTDITLKKIWMTSGAPQCENDNLTNNATGTVEVNELPAATLISLTDSVCTGSSADGKATISNVRTYETWKLYWTINGGPADSTSGTGAGSFNFTTASLTVDPSTIRLVKIVNESTGCDYLPTDEDSVIVSPVTVGGTLSGDDTVCNAANSGTLTLGADARGDVVKWEYSTDGGTTWTDINSNATSYGYSNITKTTMYRVQVQNGACGTEYSSISTITVNELPTAEIVSVGASSLCEGSSTYVALNITNVAAGLNWSLKYLQGSSVKTLTGTGPGADTIFTGALSTTTDITLQSITITSGSPLCDNQSLTNNYTTTITIIDNPTASITAYPTDICVGSTPTVTIEVDDVLSGESWTVIYKVNNGTNRTSTGVGSGKFDLNNMPVFTTVGANGVRLVSITNTTTSPNCTSQLTDSITINVDAASIGGTVSGTNKVCNGDGGKLSLSGHLGDITKWQYSTDGINYYDIANTSDSLNFSNLKVKTWYRAVVQNGVCDEANSSVIAVDVQELPTVTINNATQTICSGSSTTITLAIGNVASTDSWSLTYTENGTSGSYTGGTGTSETITFGPYTSTTTIEITGITMTTGLGCSNTISEKAVITVTPNPAATIVTVPDSLCENDFLSFTVSVDDVATGTDWELDYEVDGIAAATKKGTGSGNFTVNTARRVTPTSTKIKLTKIALDNTLACSSTLSDSAEIKVSPTTVGGTLAPSTATVCNGGSATLTLTGETGAVQNWEYSTDGGNTWTVTSNTADTLNPTNITTTTLYRVFVQSGTCAGAYSTTATITVIETPTATVTSNALVCPGDVATFTLHVSNVAATDGWSVVYKRNGVTASAPLTGTGSGDFTFTVAGGTYTGNPTLITVELESITNTTHGCSNTSLTSSATARITPNPIASFTAISNCEDSTIVFSNTSTLAEGNITTYKWYFGDGDSSVNGSPTHEYASAGTYSVRLIVWSDNGCSGETTQSITVHPNPTADFTFSNVCKNADFMATDNSSVASGSIVSWSWTFGDGSSSSAQNPTHRYATSGNFDVTLTVITDNGCSNTITKTVIVYILPEANFVASPVCENDAMDFVNASAIGYGTMTYDWNFAGQGTSVAKDPSFTFSGFGNFNVTLVATSNNGCMDTIVRAVEVHPAPTASFTVNAVCIGEASSFVNTSTVPSGTITEYFWDFGDLEFSGLENPTHTYAAPGSYDVVLRVKSALGCESTFTAKADVIDLPSVDLTANGPTAFCDGDSVTLSVNSIARTFDWSWDGGTSTNPSIVAKTTGWYKVTITAPPIGCSNTDSIFIDVWPLPDAKAWPRHKVTQTIDTISKGQSIELHASGGVSYDWNPLTFLNPTSGADITAERVDESTTYTVTVTDINGCVNTAQVTVIVLNNFDLTVYNAVTPNGDGMNDTWIIENIWAYPDAEVIIFNRYGMEVYRNIGYQNDWDATYKGNDLPDGPYYYVITHPDFGDTVYKGVINVIREKN